MSILKDILEVFQGRLRLHLRLDGKPAADIVLTPREVIVDIQNPLLALELGIKNIGKENPINSYILKMAKAAGYRIKVKYKIFEIEL